MFGYWPFCIGFSLAIGGLFAKTWRINKVRIEYWATSIISCVDVLGGKLILALYADSWREHFIP